MTEWTPIQYLGYYDVPLVFFATFRGETLLFDCRFDQTLEDYSESYKVYVLPPMREEELPRDWTTLHERATRYLGEVPVSAVRFDPTRRQAVDSTVLERVTTRQAVAG